MARTIDFTEGGIIKKLIIFSIPILLAEILQNLYNTVDSLVVGNFVGEKALAAVGVCAVISQMLIGFFNGMSAGSSVLASRYFGAGDKERLSATMRNSFAFGTILGAVLSIAGILLTPTLLRMINVPEDVFGDAVSYLRIYLGGIMFTVIYNVEAGLLRAVGDSRSTLNILIFVCILNSLLDVLFVTIVKLGVAGVGVATVISQFISVCIAYRRLKSHDSAFRLTLAELSRERKLIANVVNIGLPAGMQYSLISFSNMFVWRYISGFGSIAMAGVSVATRIDRYVGMPVDTFSLALTTYVGQNVGARHAERIRQGVRSCFALSVAYCVIVGMLVYSISEHAVRLFTQDPAVVKIGLDMLHTLLPCYVITSVRVVVLGSLRGFGDTKIPMILSLVGMVVFRQIFLAVALHLDYNIRYIYIGFPLAWAVTALMLACYYFYKRDRHLRSITQS